MLFYSYFSSEYPSVLFILAVVRIKRFSFGMSSYASISSFIQSKHRSIMLVQ